MGKCSSCGKFILGGVKQGDQRFCGTACLENGFLMPVAERAAPDVVEAQLRNLHQQQCPVCGGSGPVDIYTSHTAMSFVVMTSWKSKPRLSCARCGKKAIGGGLATTALLGWWGFPFGLILTPIQLFKGVQALSSLPDPSQPSAELQRLVKLHVARTLVNQNQ